jgi:hypothetical protein
VPPEIAEGIVAAAARESAVLVAYLFGSTARGTTGPLSDVDVGVLLGDEADEEAVVGRLTDALARAFRTDRVDVVSLTAVPIPVRYQILRDGVRLLDRDRSARIRFAVETIRHYLDFEPLRTAAFARLGHTILGGS